MFLFHPFEMFEGLLSSSHVTPISDIPDIYLHVFRASCYSHSWALTRSSGDFTYSLVRPHLARKYDLRLDRSRVVLHITGPQASLQRAVIASAHLLVILAHGPSGRVTAVDTISSVIAEVRFRTRSSVDQERGSCTYQAVIGGCG
jgi:hypothetical protein